jgi:predicted Zn finger-like uncharacterized protein
VYTQCPHCDLAFRVTAPDLKRASGSVLCAGCSREFNALDKLTEDPPAVAGVADDPGSLLDTLNDFSGGHEIRIEDTGVEWRVIDEDEADEELLDDSVTPSDGITVEGDAPDPDEEAERLPAPEDDDSGLTSSVRWYLDEPVEEAAPAATPEDPESETAAGHKEVPASGGKEQLTGDAGPSTHLELDVQRYDDNTPLPEDFVEDEEPQAFARRAEDRLEPRTPEADAAQVDLVLGDADDWMDLLDEVAQRNEAAASRADSEAGAVVQAAPQEVAARDGEAQATAPSTPPPAAAGEDALAETNIGPLAEDDQRQEPAGDDFPSDIDTQFDLQALEMGIDLTGSRNLALEEQPVELELVEEEPPGDEQPGEEERAEDEIPATGPPLEPQLLAAALEEEPTHESDEQAQTTDYRAEDEDSDEAEARRREEAFEQELAAAWATSADEVNLAGATPGDARVLEDEQATPGSESSQETNDAGEPAHYVPPQTEEEMTINMLIDQDLIRLAEQQDVFTSTKGHSRLGEARHVETIIMEGDFVRHALEAELGSGSDTNGEHVRSAAGGRRSGTPKSDAPGSHDEDDILDPYVKSTDLVRGGRRRTDPPSYRVIAGVAALALVLAAQVVHAYRDALATYPAFDRTIGSIYRLLGEPLNPDWNIKEWHFEATSGRTDETEDMLTISSRLANGSLRPLPYPLLHVSLTDRWEEIIGSKVVEPGEYLDAGADPAARVPPGERFTATVRVQAPSPEATGFKLNVCYREPPDRVRCATEDFKN